jgi:DNA-binding NarL/FixJ family response regulator
MGYRFYPRIVHPEDLPLLKKIFRKILKTGYNTEKQNDMHCFACMGRIKMYPQIGEQPDYLTAYHKMVPIFENGRMRFGVCLLTCAVTGKTNKNSDNLRLYHKDNLHFDEYSFKNRKWKTHKIKHLTEIEKIILIHAMNKESNRAIAEKLCISCDKLQHILTGLYKKLDVQTMNQALLYSINHLLIFCRSDGHDVPKQKNRKTKKNKRRNKLTPEVLQQIQTCLDAGQSIRSIARNIGVSDTAIHKAIKLEKLTKK